jgi:hypothetical protein
VDAVYFDLSSAFDLVLRFVLPQKLGAFGFFDIFASWFCNYLTNRQYFVRISDIISSPFAALSGVPDGFCPPAPPV